MIVVSHAPMFFRRNHWLSVLATPHMFFRSNHWLIIFSHASMSSVLLLDVRSRHGLAECVLSEWNGHSNARMDTFWWSGQPMALRSGRLPQCPRLPGKLLYVSHSYRSILNWLNAYCFRPVRENWTQSGAFPGTTCKPNITSQLIWI